MAMLTVVAFSACTKEGVYKPGKKITKIYRSSSSHSEYYRDWEGTWESYDSETPKYLREKWKWDGKLLKSIERYDSDGDYRYSLDFKYDGKRIEKIEQDNDDAYVEYKYDGRKLEKIVYYEDGEIEIEIEVEHDGSKISELEYSYYDNKKGLSRIDDLMDISMRMFLPNEETALRVADIAKKKSKGGVETYKISLEWDGNNISEMVVKEESYKSTYKFEYDDKKNPYKGFVYELLDDIPYLFGSKNNVTKVTSSNNESNEKNVENYRYSYDGNWPVKKTYSYSENSDTYRYSSTSTTYFEYDD